MSTPTSKELAHACFEQIIESEWDPLKRKRDRLISHGDLVVIKGDPCLYYGYVAFVDRTEDSPSGYQKESTFRDGIHNKNKLLLGGIAYCPIKLTNDIKKIIRKFLAII